MKKMVFLTGPRQIGKTYLSRQLMPEFIRPVYLNYDNINDARIIREQTWALNTDFLIFDEIHRMKEWKLFIKGVYDTRPGQQSILVTGSSRLDTFRQSGESLAGRYFHYRLFPISVRELSGEMSGYDALDLLNRFGGFPEPFLSGSEDDARRWRKQYYTDIVREDILDYGRVHEIRAIQLLLELLRERVGSSLSIASLSRDLQVAPNTVRKYIEILESLHIIFLLRPFSPNIARSILKEPKVYFYDSGYVKGDEGIILENSIAVSLYKNVCFKQDIKGEEIGLHYIRTKEGKEVDFAVTRNGNLSEMIEVKLSDSQISKNLSYFSDKFPSVKAIQLVHNLRIDRHNEKINIHQAGKWLSGLDA